MSNRFFEKGKQGLADGSIDFDTDNHSGRLLDLGTADTHVKAVTGATNATPIVLTVTAHGYANNDIVVIGGVAGNLAANGTYLVKNQATNTFELQTLDGQNTTGSAAYTSGGYAVNMTAATNLQDVDAGVVGSAVALASKAVSVGGVLNCTSPVTFTAVTGASVEAFIVYKDTGSAATSRLLLFNDGRIRVEVAAAASSSATTIAVLPLEAAIPNSTALVFSNGITGTLTAGASAGARTLTVSAISGAIAAGHQCDAPYTSNGLPITPNGGDINFVVDTGNNKLGVI